MLMSLLIFGCTCVSLLLAGNPFRLGVMLMTMSLACCLFVSLYSTFYSLVLLIIYIGGLMVSFCYFIALCPNQESTTSILGWCPSALLFVVFEELSVMGFLKSLEVMDIFHSQNFSSLLGSVLVLLVGMVAVVKVSKVVVGPLRGFI